MRVVNQNLETITDFDLERGSLIPVAAVREDAKPIDNVVKFAWYDEDYEQVQMYIPNPVPTAQEQILELKEKLRQTDFHILKIVEGASTLTECAEVIKQRAVWREEIRKLERKG